MTTATRLKIAARTGRWLGAGAVLLALALPGMEALAAGIADTRHNLTSTSTGENKTTAGTGSDEICVFCHTPHAANSGTVAGLPLWNKGLPSGSSYTTYSSTTMDATANLTTGSTSLACLSCHDGTQAMDNLINAPGFGGYTAGGTSAGFTWTGARQTAGKMTNSGQYISMLGTDLSNDHPIGIPYCAGTTGANAAAWMTSCVDKDFKTISSGTGGDSSTIWWVDMGTPGRQRTDIILYARADGKPYVECASCHDPHVKEGETYSGSGLVAGRTFLRVANTGSAVCLACHNK